MSRRTQEIGNRREQAGFTLEEIAAQEQAADSYILQRAKELLCELWKQGRIDMNVRTEGDVALSAALFAVENPAITKVTKRIGALAAGEQWRRDQEKANATF